MRLDAVQFFVAGSIANVLSIVSRQFLLSFCRQRQFSHEPFRERVTKLAS
jgi:hypothetical protein